jgi:anti-sigma factor RsiW
MTRALPDELECRELVEITTEYLEGALPLADRTRLEHHLAYCAACDTFVRQLRMQKRAFTITAAAEIEPVSRARLLAAFRGWKAGRSE